MPPGSDHVERLADRRVRTGRFVMRSRTTPVRRKRVAADHDGGQVTPATLPLPHERDQSVDQGMPAPIDPRVEQAQKDVSRGLQDTDRGPEVDALYTNRLKKAPLKRPRVRAR